jgi:translocator protein
MKHLLQNKIVIFVLCISIPFLAGFIGSFFTMDAIPTWYAGLNKPDFNPPNWIFGPVWSLLYLLMGVSLYLIWNSEDKSKKFAIWVFATQIILNTLWSILFFGMQNPLIAFIEIIILWIVIALNIFLFFKINKVAGILLVPYILWVSFASFLNYSIMILN